jgi:DNA-binding transcriptional LysR family regulator
LTISWSCATCAPFVAVADELHFGRAAARLHMAQPPLSQLLRRLEGELGLVLFHRNRRRVELSEAGATLLPAARATVAAADGLATLAADVADGRAGSLTIGFVGSAAAGALPVLVRLLRAEAPDVRITLRELTSARQQAALRYGTIDAGLLREPPAASDLSSTVLEHEPLLAALPAGHPLCRRARLSVADLADEPWVLFPRDEGPAFHARIDGLCRAAGFAPRVEQEATYMATIANLVAAGLGVSLVPAAMRDTAPSGLELRPVRERDANVPLVLAWRTQGGGPALRRFLALAAGYRA